jgi:hypothetical protein
MKDCQAATTKTQALKASFGKTVNLHKEKTKDVKGQTNMSIKQILSSNQMQAV